MLIVLIINDHEQKKLLALKKSYVTEKKIT